MTGRRLSALSLVSTLFLFGSPFAASPLAGQAKTLEIEQFDADINVLPSGSRRDRTRPGASPGHWTVGPCLHGLPRFDQRYRQCY